MSNRGRRSGTAPAAFLLLLLDYLQTALQAVLPAVEHEIAALVTVQQIDTVKLLDDLQVEAVAVKGVDMNSR